jgi:hypothetical protein
MKKLLYCCSAIILLLSASFFTAHSQQCASCTMSAAFGVDTSDIIVSTGQTLCIPAGTLVRGHITLSGGAVCNEGVLASAPSGSGTLNNYGTVNISSSFDLSGIIVTNNTNAAFNVAGNFTLNGGSFTNEGTLNVTSSVSVNSGSIINDGTLNYINLNNNGGTFTNNGTANCCGN